MPSLNLFPHEDDLLIPAPDRRDPVLWLRRLVIVPSLINGVMPIREIEFRRGLNIIQTRLPEAGSNEVVGHSVGKTLLTRLIRYSLGVPGFSSVFTLPILARPENCSASSSIGSSR